MCYSKELGAPLHVYAHIFYSSLLLKRARRSFVIDPGAWDESRLPPRTRLPSSGHGELVLLEVRDCLTCLHPGLLK